VNRVFVRNVNGTMPTRQRAIGTKLLFSPGNGLSTDEC